MRCPARAWIGGVLLAAAALGAAAHMRSKEGGTSTAGAAESEPTTVVHLLSELVGALSRLTMELQMPGGSRLVSAQTGKAGHKTTIQLSFSPEAASETAAPNSESSRIKIAPRATANEGSGKVTKTNRGPQTVSKVSKDLKPLPYQKRPTSVARSATAPSKNRKQTSVYEEQMEVSVVRSPLERVSSLEAQDKAANLVQGPSRSMFGLLTPKNSRYLMMSLTFLLRLLDAVRQLISVLASAFTGQYDYPFARPITHTIADTVAHLISG